MGTPESVREWLEDHEAPEEVREFFEGSSLRAKLEEAETRAKQAETRADKAEGKLTKIERAPVLKKSLEKLGVDYDNQPRFGKKALDSFDWEGDEPDLEKLAEYLSEEGFEVAKVEETTDQPAAGQIANHGQAAASRFVQTETTAQKIQEAESAGDWETSRRLKTQLQEEMASR